MMRTSFAPQAVCASLDTLLWNAKGLVEVERTLRRYSFPTMVGLILSAVYIPRLFILGFYSDDWIVFLNPLMLHGRFSWEMLNELLTNYPSRPGFDVCSWLCMSILGSHAFLWQAALTASTIFIAGLAARLATALNTLGGRSRLSPQALFLVFLAAPWTYGFTAWPVLLPAHPAVILFLLSAVLTVKGLTSQRIHWPAFLLFCLSSLIYECCYLQFLPVLLLAWVLSPNRCQKSFLYRCGSYLAGFSAAQAAAIGMKFLLCGSLAGPKTVQTEWFTLAANGIVHFPQMILQSACAYRTTAYYCCFACWFTLAVLFATSFFVFRAGRRGSGFPSEQESFFRIGVGSGARACELEVETCRQNMHGLLAALGCLAILFGAIAFSYALYALIGYGIVGRGEGSRTTMGLTVWVSFLTAVLTGKFAVRESKTRHLLRLLAFGALLIGLTAASTKRLRDWAGAWKLEQQVLNAAPIDEIEKTGPDALIVAFVPVEYRGVNVFSNSWELGPALNAIHPTAGCSPLGNRLVFTQSAGMKAIWDGECWQQSVNGVKTSEKHVKEVWVWDYFHGEFYPAVNGKAIE